MVSLSSLLQDEGEATFQLALISDRLTSYALVYYASGAMTWTYRGRWSYVTMGVSDGSVDNYQPNVYTKTETAYRIDTVPGNTGKVCQRNLYTKTETAYRIDTVPGNTGKVCQRKLYTRTERVNRIDSVPESTGLCKDKRHR